jgi:hypothetical protein
MGSVSILNIDGKEVLVIDYSGCKEAEMMKLLNQLKALVYEVPEKKRLILSCHSNSYLTTSFLRHAETKTNEALHHIDKLAFTGLDPVNKIILKGYALMFKRNFKVFNTREEALAYLLSDTTSDLDKEVNPSIHD